ncbi:SdpI family protein [Gottfriedia luciferensis]|uniref:SdpI family protein n=1 Tax=Gottfriedia luciferensis TaxID=178774 RepID=UPI000B44B90B|nr:SdpI family protein [Gottfriedia luciferensis]
MKKHLIAVLLFIISIVLWSINYQDLPAKLPVHWDISGHVNNYDSKLQTFIELHVIMLFVYLLPFITPKIDPRKENYKYFQRSFYLMTTGMLFLFFLINLSVLYYGLGYNIQIGSLVFIFIGLLFILLGNYLPHVRSNYFIGVRTPWTLSSESVWRKTHRVSGRLFMLIGLCFLFLYFIPIAYKTYVFIPLIILLVGFPIIYSYFIFKKEMKI